MGRIPESEFEKLYNLGVTYFDSGKYEKAIECFTKAIDLEPNDAFAWKGKGMAFSDSGKYEEAVKCFDESTKLDPDDMDVWYRKGWTLHYLGKYEESIKCYDEAIDQDPTNASIWFNKGSTLSRKSRMHTLHLTDSGPSLSLEEANKCYDEALKLDPTNMLAWLDKGTVLHGLGKDKEAAKCYDEGAELVWYRIVENVGKTMKTKTGVVFSYRIKGDKIIPQYHLKLTHSNPDLAGKKYGEGVQIKKSQVREAFVRVPIKGPTQIKDIIFRPEHLWAILHDPRISDGNW